MIGTRHLLKFWRDDDGTAVVEGAIVIPVLMTLMFGTYEFAWYFYQQQLITTGVHDAARYLARVADPTIAANQTSAKNLATTGSTTTACTTSSAPNVCRVSGWMSANITITINSDANTGSSTPCGTAACYGGTGGNIQVVVVSTTFPDPGLSFFGFLGLTAPSIQVSQSERVVIDSAP